MVIGGLDRPNLFLQAMHCPTEDHRWRRLLMLLDQCQGAGIVYVPEERGRQVRLQHVTRSGTLGSAAVIGGSMI